MRTLPTGCLNSPVLNPKLAGEVRLVLDFGDDQGTNVRAIVYAEFENLMDKDNGVAIGWHCGPAMTNVRSWTVTLYRWRPT